MIQLTDLLSPITSDDIKKSIYKVLAKVGVDTTVWKPGAVVRTIIAAVAIVLAALSSLIALIAASGFLSLAQGGWLTLVARYVYGVERQLATYASGLVTLTNTGGGLYTLDPGDLILKNLDTGKTYTNTQAITINPTSTLTNVAIVATEVGSASTSLAGTITGFGTPLSGVTCTNPAAVIGQDDESDPDLQTRCLDKLGSLSPNGPPDAYAFVTRSAVRADGTKIGVNRLNVSKDGYGNVFLIVASPSGVVPGTEDDDTSDLGIIYESLLSQAAPLCVTPNLQSAAGVTQAITATMYAYNTTGLNEAGAIAAASSALSKLFPTLPIGGHSITPGTNLIYRQELADAIAEAVPSTFLVKFTPDADIALAANQVLQLGAVSLSVVFQSRATL